MRVLPTAPSILKREVQAPLTMTRSMPPVQNLLRYCTQMPHVATQDCPLAVTLGSLTRGNISIRSGGPNPLPWNLLRVLLSRVTFRVLYQSMPAHATESQASHPAIAPQSTQSPCRGRLLTRRARGRRDSTEGSSQDSDSSAASDETVIRTRRSKRRRIVAPSEYSMATMRTRMPAGDESALAADLSRGIMPPRVSRPLDGTRIVHIAAVWGPSDYEKWSRCIESVCAIQ